REVFMARPIMRRKSDHNSLIPANPVTRLDNRLELVYFEKGPDGQVTIYEEDPGEAPSPKPKRSPRKRKAEAIPEESSDDSELDTLMAGLESGETS
ncbi:unnamed protein product, partial [marine sediment metagenome]